MSRQRTLAYLDCLGENHDAEVIEWKETLENRMINPHEVIFLCINFTMIIDYHVFNSPVIDICRC